MVKSSSSSANNVLDQTSCECLWASNVLTINSSSVFLHGLNRKSRQPWLNGFFSSWNEPFGCNSRLILSSKHLKMVVEIVIEVWLTLYHRKVIRKLVWKGSWLRKMRRISPCSSPQMAKQSRSKSKFFLIGLRSVKKLALLKRHKLRTVSASYSKSLDKRQSPKSYKPLTQHKQSPLNQLEISLSLTGSLVGS